VRAGEGETGGRGLLLVEVLAHRWGWGERAGGIGKTVWAEVKAPGLAPVERDGVEVAAVTVRSGQCVRVWGAWRTVRRVSTQRSVSGGLTVVIGLDEGPALRMPAGAPVTVRDVGAGHAGR
jgi:hypothetical protein